jgi:hypothetical protein
MFSYATIDSLTDRVLQLAGRMAPVPPAGMPATPEPDTLTREQLLERIALEFDALGTTAVE